MEILGNLAKLVRERVIAPCDLRDAKDLFKLLDFVAAGIEACKETLLFPMGRDTIVLTHENCEYHCKFNGELICYDEESNDVLGNCNLNDFNDVFMAIFYRYDTERESDTCDPIDFFDEEQENKYQFSFRLESFLKLQLQEAKSNAMADINCLC